LTVRYPLTVGFGIVCIVLVIIGSWLLIHRTTQGANKQLIHTLKAEIEEDLTRDLDRLRLSGVPVNIDVSISGDQLDTWMSEVSRDIGASVAVLFDLDGKPVWSSDPAHGGSGDFEAKDVEIALAGGVITELVHDVLLVDARGRYYVSDAMETYLPLFSASGDEEIGVIEVYADVRGQLKEASDAARSNIFGSVIEVMVALTLLLIGSVFVVELLLNRARRRRDEAERRRVETDSVLALAKTQSREAEIARQERERFLSVVSHELKTPLTSILAFTDILTRDRDGALTERQLKHLDLVKRNGRRLDGLINDILDVSRIETGRLSLETTEFEIGELFDDLTLSLESIFQEKSQKLIVAPPLGDELLVADRSRIFQAVSNLLSNASKYSPENSTITFRGTVEDNRLRMSVTDEGFGLSENDRLHIFDLFYRASNEQTRTVAGLGVGLAIVRSIIESHNGSVTVDSAPGTGSTFAIEIPGVIASPSGKYPISREAAA
ncbi:MAG: HAMP domain-containing histidine kinase, partial [Chloroflexi bacterium]|nr:HAMP domain-containing histidine kinase [Chloroflexota bacterium]